jgi:hypothetical protein
LAIQSENDYTLNSDVLPFWLNNSKI